MVKKVIIISILIAIVLFVMYRVIDMFSPHIIPSNTHNNISQYEKKLTNSIGEIFVKNTKRDVSCEFIHGKFAYEIDSNKINYENINKDERALSVYVYGSYLQNLKPVEIYSVFESFMFLRNEELSYKIVAISCVYTSGGIDNTLEIVTALRLSEFQELCKNTDINGLSNSKAAKKLAEKWIKQTGYVKK